MASQRLAWNAIEPFGSAVFDEMNKVLERTGFRLFECGPRELDGGGAGASLLKAL
jgi:hypothetical protein